MVSEILAIIGLGNGLVIYFELDPQKYIYMKLYQKSNIIIEETAFKIIVCKMLVMLIWPQGVK